MIKSSHSCQDKPTSALKRSALIIYLNKIWSSSKIDRWGPSENLWLTRNPTSKTSKRVRQTPPSKNELTSFKGSSQWTLIVKIFRTTLNSNQMAKTTTVKLTAASTALQAGLSNRLRLTKMSDLWPTRSRTTRITTRQANLMPTFPLLVSREITKSWFQKLSPP